MNNRHFKDTNYQETCNNCLENSLFLCMESSKYSKIDVKIAWKRLWMLANWRQLRQEGGAESEQERSPELRHPLTLPPSLDLSPNFAQKFAGVNVIKLRNLFLRQAMEKTKSLSRNSPHQTQNWSKSLLKTVENLFC